jgi:stearoyl-CoA desaturase (delta-9 desaturase)
LVAVIAVPWYGFTKGFSLGSWAFFAFFLIANEMSITGGYHRLWAHRAYEAHPALRWFFMIFGSMALQNSALVWCSGHRTHHLHVDDYDKDPYSAKRGFWFSHIGWMLREYPSGKQDFANIPDLKRDPLLQFQHRFYVPLVLITNFGFPLLAGWIVGDILGTMILAGVLRLVLSHHFTFFINSLAHMWGNRPYTDENTARDNPVLAVLTYGEGYHNFHHIFAHDYRNGVRWWQWDPTKWMIAGLSFIGITRRLKRTPGIQIQRALLSMQFARAQEKLAQHHEAGHSHIEQLRARIAHEYETFTAALSEWAKVKEEWLEEKKRMMVEHWEHSALQQRLLEIEASLRTQRRRMRVISAQLA